MTVKGAKVGLPVPPGDACTLPYLQDKLFNELRLSFSRKIARYSYVSGGLAASPRPPEASIWLETEAGRAKTWTLSASTTRARTGRPGPQSTSRACTDASVA